jgi:DNA mismatch endonuclease (patch repair protein)
VVFVHGCFWHGHAGCPRATVPSTNTRFWEKKISANKARDLLAKRQLGAIGWKVFVVWQCQMRNNEKLTERLSRFLQNEV